MFDLKGVDTGKVGSNKYVNYKVSDFIDDQNITPRAGLKAITQQGFGLGDLKVVPRETTLGKVGQFLNILPRDFYLPKSLTETLARKDKAKEEKVSTDPLGDIKAIYKEQMEYEKAMDPFKRKGRALDSAMEFANLRTQMPFYMNQLKDLTTFKQQQLLDSELVKQSMPDAREARKLSSASRFAGELGAVADAYAKAGTVAQGGIRQPTATFSV